MKALTIGCLLSCFFSSMCTQKKTPSENGHMYYHPTGASWRVKGLSLSYCLWYNPDQWMIFSNPIYETEKKEQEWMLVLLDKRDRITIGRDAPIRSVAFTYTFDDKNLTENAIKNRVAHSLLTDIKGLKEFEDLGSEKRIVNGVDVWMWKIKFATVDLGEVLSMNYYYSGDEGSISIVTLTPMKYWEENKEKVGNLLNGFCTTAKEKNV